MDNLFYEVTSADDGICGPMPGAGNDLMPPSAPGEGSAASSAHATPSWAMTLGGAVATAAAQVEVGIRRSERRMKLGAY